ncbi:DUF397 domain-containing protein [Actinomadura logoneensis]|uniref:DUF397 domain-containing protein n=1 Tax=Actinomadura logoneensis TaxID=2293572 RepID=A0A372JA77_9ACTN|nr:DUF397 domain-containing protein [Actinomadura logoneensis]RFU36829.1 DUF397 domain-containing protein [Actinomadura logoneensis]
MSKPDPSNVRWRKSSHSGDTGGDCVELGGVWRKSSRSTDTGGQCVELAGCPHDVAVRDSKDPDGPRLVFDASVFGAFARRVKAGALDLV